LFFLPLQASISSSKESSSFFAVLARRDILYISVPAYIGRLIEEEKDSYLFF
jgi:hypothetical protein